MSEVATVTLLDTLVGLPETPDRPEVRLLSAWEKSPAWVFVCRSAPKIRKKLRSAVDFEDRLDLAVELRWGLMLSQDPLNCVTYEAHGPKRGRGPDYSVVRGGMTFNVEVKRIRVTLLESRLDCWLERMRVRFLALKPQQRLLAGFQLLDLDDRDCEDWLDELEDREDQLARRAEEWILQSCLSVGQSHDVGLAKGVTLTLWACDGEPRVGNAGSTFPVMYTQREHMKLGTVLMESLGQMRPGEVNVLAVDTYNATHECHDLRDALHELRGCDASVFARYGFDGREDFWNRVRALSGVVFRTSWRPALARPRNYVWVNSTATNPLPRDLQCYLADIDGL